MTPEPPTVAEVVIFGTAHGMAPEVVLRWFEEQELNGWLFQGQTIVPVWRGTLLGYRAFLAVEATPAWQPEPPSPRIKELPFTTTWWESHPEPPPTSWGRSPMADP